MNSQALRRLHRYAYTYVCIYVSTCINTFILSAPGIGVGCVNFPVAQWQSIFIYIIKFEDKKSIFIIKLSMTKLYNNCVCVIIFMIPIIITKKYSIYFLCFVLLRMQNDPPNWRQEYGVPNELSKVKYIIHRDRLYVQITKPTTTLHMVSCLVNATLPRGCEIYPQINNSHIPFPFQATHTHRHKHIRVYTFVYVCVYVCVCGGVFKSSCKLNHQHHTCSENDDDDDGNEVTSR